MPRTPTTPARTPGPAPDRARAPQPAPPDQATDRAPETGGRQGPEPTRYGDWEVNGICTDF